MYDHENSGLFVAAKSRQHNVKYWSCCELVEKFGKENLIQSKPVLPICVAMYIYGHLKDHDKSHNVKSSIAAYAIGCVHNLNEYFHLTESGMDKQLFEASKRLRS